ncbi:MAG: hypothetical protein LBI87_01225 [Candidatus Accumulibacter sp.]|jgi:preprotein translocase subunit SecG|nr:hypothetical protein [Accumulibacter sp.]
MVKIILWSALIFFILVVVLDYFQQTLGKGSKTPPYPEDQEARDLELTILEDYMERHK